MIILDLITQACYKKGTMDKGVIHVLSMMEGNHVRFQHATQNLPRFKMFLLFSH